MALREQALTTLATVRSELSLTSSADDTYLCRLIEGASDFIAQYCNRDFYKATVTEKVKGFGAVRIVLSRTPIISIASISYLGSTIDSDSYEIENASTGFLYRSAGWNWTAQLWLNTTDDVAVGSERAAFSATYTGGYVTPNQSGTRTLPYDLEDVCIQLVTQRYRRRGQDASVESESLGDYDVTYAGRNEDRLPASAKRVLDGYKRPVIA